MSYKILIIEDSISIINTLKGLIQDELDVEIFVAKSMKETRTFSFRDIYEQVLRPSGYEISGSDDPLFDYVADDSKYNQQMNFYEFKDDLEKVLKAVKSANETRAGFDKDIFLFQVDMFIKNIRDWGDTYDFRNWW